MSFETDFSALYFLVDGNMNNCRIDAAGGMHGSVNVLFGKLTITNQSVLETTTVNVESNGTLDISNSTLGGTTVNIGQGSHFVGDRNTHFTSGLGVEIFGFQGTLNANQAERVIVRNSNINIPVNIDNTRFLVLTDNTCRFGFYIDDCPTQGGSPAPCEVSIGGITINGGSNTFINRVWYNDFFISSFALDITDARGVDMIQNTIIHDAQAQDFGLEAEFGLRLNNCNNAKVFDLTSLYEIDPSNRPDPGKIIYTAIDALNCSSLEITSCSELLADVCMKIVNCPKAEISGNSAGLILPMNEVTNVPVVQLENNNDLSFCSNAIVGEDEGTQVSGLHVRMAFSDNDIASQQKRALIYKQDVISNPQIDQGNDFASLGSLEAEFEGATQLQSIPTRYETDQFASIQHAPDDWFRNGNDNPNCVATSGDTVDPESCPGCTPPGEIGIIAGRGYLDLPSAYDDGYAMQYKKLVLQAISSDPSILGFNVISTFCNAHCGSSLDQLPMYSEIAEDLYQLDEAAGLPSDDVLLANPGAYENQLKALEDDRETRIQYWLSVVSPVSPTDTYEANYQTVLLHYLNTELGNTPSESEQVWIADLAAGCMSNDGPAIYTARGLANSLGINYTIDASCGSAAPRPVIEDKIASENHFSLVSNLVNRTLNIRELKDQTTLSVYGVSGALHLQFEASSGTLQSVSGLKPGLYIIRSTNEAPAVKFVKYE